MRVLTYEEIEEVSGGDEIAVLAGELAALCHEGGVVGLALGFSLIAGLGAGELINFVIQDSTGQSLGAWTYDGVQSLYDMASSVMDTMSQWLQDAI